MQKDFTRIQSIFNHIIDSGLYFGSHPHSSAFMCNSLKAAKYNNILDKETVDEGLAEIKEVLSVLLRHGTMCTAVSRAVELGVLDPSWSAVWDHNSVVKNNTHIYTDWKRFCEEVQKIAASGVMQFIFPEGHKLYGHGFDFSKEQCLKIVDGQVQEWPPYFELLIGDEYYSADEIFKLAKEEFLKIEKEKKELNKVIYPAKYIVVEKNDGEVFSNQCMNARVCDVVMIANSEEEVLRKMEELADITGYSIRDMEVYFLDSPVTICLG